MSKIDFSRALMTNAIIHYVGNKGLGESIILNEEQLLFSDDFEKETLLRFLLAGFGKDQIFYQFRGAAEKQYEKVVVQAGAMFEDRGNFADYSRDLAKHLYNQSMHPKIFGGQFYVLYFKDVIVAGECVDCVGLFKNEKRITFLEVENDVEIHVRNGIDLKKLDKGCLIFNLDKANGYTVALFDNNAKGETAIYWSGDFLDTEIKKDDYYYTSQFLEALVCFDEEHLASGTNLSKEERRAILSKGINFVMNQEKVTPIQFAAEVFAGEKQHELVRDFRDFKKKFAEVRAVDLRDEFTVSDIAAKAFEKYAKGHVRLDHNFEIIIKGRHDYLEKGFDEAKGLKYYKLYYVNEDVKS